MVVQRSSERIQAQFEEASPRRQRSRLVIDFVDLLPVVHFRHQFVSWSVADQILVLIFEEHPPFAILDVGDLLFVNSQIRFHVVVALFRFVDVKFDQIAQHVVVEADDLAVVGDFFEQFHFVRTEALVDFGIVLDGIDVQPGGVQLIDVKGPQFTVGDDRLGGQRVSGVVIRGKSLVASLSQQPSKAGYNCLGVNRFLAFTLTVLGVSEWNIIAAVVRQKTEFVTTTGPES